jgi:hypothetical protein
VPAAFQLPPGSTSTSISPVSNQLPPNGRSEGAGPHVDFDVTTARTPQTYQSLDSVIGRDQAVYVLSLFFDFVSDEGPQMKVLHSLLTRAGIPPDPLPASADIPIRPREEEGRVGADIPCLGAERAGLGPGTGAVPPAPPGHTSRPRSQCITLQIPRTLLPIFGEVSPLDMAGRCWRASRSISNGLYDAPSLELVTVRYLDGVYHSLCGNVGLQSELYCRCRRETRGADGSELQVWAKPFTSGSRWDCTTSRPMPGSVRVTRSTIHRLLLTLVRTPLRPKCGGGFSV